MTADGLGRRKRVRGGRRDGRDRGCGAGSLQAGRPGAGRRAGILCAGHVGRPNRRRPAVGAVDQRLRTCDAAARRCLGRHCVRRSSGPWAQSRERRGLPLRVRAHIQAMLRCALRRLEGTVKVFRGRRTWRGHDAKARTRWDATAGAGRGVPRFQPGPIREIAEPRSAGRPRQVAPTPRRRGAGQADEGRDRRGGPARARYARRITGSGPGSERARAGENATDGGRSL